MLISLYCLSQTPDLQIDGTVKEGRIKLKGAKVVVRSGAAIIDQATTNESGKFVFVLPLDKVYTVCFQKSGYVTKKISIDTRGIAKEEAKNGFGFGGWEVVLFKEIPGLDVSVLDKPIGKIRYEPKLGEFDYDKEYTATIHRELERLQSELAEKEAAYQKAISTGDAALNKGNYQEAVDAYDRALTVKPSEPYPKTKKEEARKKLKEQQENEASDIAFNSLITKADKAFKGAEFEEAKALYKQASEKKPSETYPKKQIAECEKAIKLLADHAAKDKAYNDAIATADKAFAAKDYRNARTAYQKASGIKPKETYPKEQMAAVDKLLADQAALAEKEKAYKSAIASADKLFGTKSWDQARTAYRKASGVKPDENYPKEKISEINRIIKEEAAQAAKDKAYKSAITKADKYFAAKALEESLTAYKDASEIKPEEAYPKQKIVAINRILQEQQENAQKEDAYKKAVARGDNAFNNARYPDAKTAYNDALKIKPGESYPSNRIVLCDKKIKDRQELAAKEKAYADAIALADQNFNTKKYKEARGHYTEALAIKQNESYPKEQVARIDKIIAEIEAIAMAQEEKEAAYKKRITTADNAYGSKDYEAALKDYTKASAIKPEENYPKEKISEIQDILNKRAAAGKKDEDYRAKVKEGDDALESMHLNAALQAYKQAGQIKPDENYPPAQIEKVNRLLEERAKSNRLEQDYQSALSEADAAFKAKNYDSAETNYKKAAGIKPDETYPPAQIAKIEAIRRAEQAQNEKDAAYAEAIEKADASFSAKDYNTARSAYLEAQDMKPLEQYPQQQLKKIDGILSNAMAAEEKEKAYQLAIQHGDGAFGADKFKDARSYYQKAEVLKPEESYPKEQLAEIDKRLKALADATKEDAEKLEHYKEVLAKADFLFQTQKYAGAKIQYETAGGIMPDKQYPKDQLAKIEKLMQMTKAPDTEAGYQTAIEKADKLFNSENFKEAVTPYQEALAIKAGDPYAKRQIDRIETILQRKTYIEKQQKARAELLARKEREAREAQARNNVQNKDTDVGEQSSREEFVDELAKNYPQGVTEETYQEGNKTIVKRVVVKGNHGTEYRKITHTWGGVFYFKSDKPISEFIWLKETGD